MSDGIDGLLSEFQHLHGNQTPWKITGELVYRCPECGSTEKFRHMGFELDGYSRVIKNCLGPFSRDSFLAGECHCLACGCCDHPDEFSPAEQSYPEFSIRRTERKREKERKHQLKLNPALWRAISEAAESAAIELSGRLPIWFRMNSRGVFYTVEKDSGIRLAYFATRAKAAKGGRASPAFKPEDIAAKYHYASQMAEIVGLVEAKP